MARPTDYNESMITKANEYIDSCGREATELPTVEGCAKALGVARDTIYEWIKPEHWNGSRELQERTNSEGMNTRLI